MLFLFYHFVIPVRTYQINWLFIAMC